MQVGHEPKQRRLKTENGKEMCHVADSDSIKTEFNYCDGVRIK